MNLFYFDGNSTTEGIEKGCLEAWGQIQFCDERPPHIDRHNRIHAATPEHVDESCVIRTSRQDDDRALLMVENRCELPHRNGQKNSDPYLICGTYDFDQTRPLEQADDEPRTTIWMRALIVVHPEQVVVVQDANRRWGELKYTPNKKTAFMFHLFEGTIEDKSSAHMRA